MIAYLPKSVTRQGMALVGSELVEVCRLSAIFYQPAAPLFVEGSEIVLPVALPRSAATTRRFLRETANAVTNARPICAGYVCLLI